MQDAPVKPLLQRLCNPVQPPHNLVLPPLLLLVARKRQDER